MEAIKYILRNINKEDRRFSDYLKDRASKIKLLCDYKNGYYSLKICLVINNFNYHGGSQVIVNIAKNLLSAGYGVDIIAIRSTKADLASRPKTQATDLLAPNMLKG